MRTPDELRTLGSVKWTYFPDTIGAFVAEMDFGTAPAVTRALHDAVDDARFGYRPAALTQANVDATAAWCAERYDWPVDPADIHILGDVLTGYAFAIEHATDPDTPIIVPTPAYMPFLTIPKARNRAIIEVPYRWVDGEARLDLDGIDAAFHSGGQLLVLCNPANPVGRVFRREELEALAALVARHGGRVFADEIHAPLTFPGHRHIPYASISATAAAHTITAIAATKAWNFPGLKAAQLILTADADRAAWDRVGAGLTQGASILGVIATTTAYREGSPWLADLLTVLDENRTELARLLTASLPEVGYTPPEGTYIGWLDLTALALDDPATFFRDQARVALTDGRACGAAGIGHVRFVFATPRPILAEAVDRMAAALAARPRA